MILGPFCCCLQPAIVGFRSACLRGLADPQTSAALPGPLACCLWRPLKAAVMEDQWLVDYEAAEQAAKETLQLIQARTSLVAPSGSLPCLSS